MTQSPNGMSDDDDRPVWRLAQPARDRELIRPARELLEDRARTGHFGLAREVLDGLVDPERAWLLEDLFWYGLDRADWELAAFCIAAGYPVDPESEVGDGVIHDALIYLPGRPDVIDWLLDQGAEIERRGRNHFTPLLYASQIGEVETVAVLLRHGAEIDAGSIIDDNMTALIAAAVTGNLPVVQLLLEHGADANRRLLFTGEDAVQLSEENEYFEIAKLIRHYQSKKSD
ncbi:Ankyrin repeat-containing protein [Singulisphaera sp. GP187]|uniref:ankyrin repeat domain-containing protein n=1 Tax=Singulisphaera sp. GP187 TaxID=1882752 RepID=UPI000928AE84|nr:ankyrin repeat domain-containing protein [Singulisphaera sp. GP187]SIO65992.1 Ankyrin repeat-containing protein [Singulisphaera sp. GP187]